MIKDKKKTTTNYPSWQNDNTLFKSGDRGELVEQEYSSHRSMRSAYMSLAIKCISPALTASLK